MTNSLIKIVLLFYKIFYSIIMQTIETIEVSSNGTVR